MSFTLPAEVARILQQATDLNITDSTVLRCHWPSVRDVTWASAQADRANEGTASSNNAYAAHLIAASLIGLNGLPLSDMTKDESLLALLNMAPEEMSDEQHATLAAAKYGNIVARLPGDLVYIAFNRDFLPWMSEKNGEAKGIVTAGERVKRLLEALDSQGE